MGSLSLKYTGTEAVDIIKNYYPEDWQKRISNKKETLVKLAERHNISLEKAYRKFIIPLGEKEECIVFFAALFELMKIKSLVSKQKSEKVIEMEFKRKNVANQIVALENSNITSYEDKKILRAYYNRLQQEITTQINELINSFEVIDPQLIIHQPGLFDAKFNG